MKLFDEQHRYTPEANALQGEFEAAIRPVFTRWADMGYSPREISHLLQGAVWDNELMRVLR